MRHAILACCGFWIAVGWTSAGRAQEEIMAEIQRTATPPTIDGIGDEDIWAAATAHDSDEFYVVAGEDLEDDADLSVIWKALWDDDNLYVLVNVYG
jgi:hypothetical protein